LQRHELLVEGLDLGRLRHDGAPFADPIHKTSDHSFAA